MSAGQGWGGAAETVADELLLATASGVAVEAVECGLVEGELLAEGGIEGTTYAGSSTAGLQPLVVSHRANSPAMRVVGDGHRLARAS